MLMKRLDTAHHRWQRNVIGVSWRDKLTNEEMLGRTGQRTIDSILTERRLRWLGHVLWMDHQHPPQYNKHYTGKFLVTRETRPTKNKLEMCNQEGFGEDGTCLGGGSVSSSQQTRMASTCGTMHPPVSGMNRGQGQGIDSVGYVTGRASLSLWPVKILHEQSLKVTSILWSPCGAPSLTWSNICINRLDKQL